MPGPFGFTNAFTSGELDENAWDRTDLQQVAKGCARAQNLLDPDRRPAGEARRLLAGRARPPTRRTPTRVLAFRKSWADSCLLEFSDLACHVWNLDGTPMIDPGPALPLVFVTPFAAARLPLLRWKQVQDVIYFRSIDGMAPQTLSRAAISGWRRPIGRSPLTTFINGPWLAENTDLALTVTLTNTGGPADILDGNPPTGAGRDPGATVVTVRVDGPDSTCSTPSWSARRCASGPTATRSQLPRPGRRPTSTSLGDFVTSIGNMYSARRRRRRTARERAPTRRCSSRATRADGVITWTYLHDGAGVVELDRLHEPDRDRPGRCCAPCRCRAARRPASGPSPPTRRPMAGRPPGRKSARSAWSTARRAATGIGPT